MSFNLSNIKVSYQENTWSSISKEISIIETLNIIKSDILKGKILTLRNKLENGKEEFYDNNKKKLPAVTFCATFNENRKKENLKKYNSFIVIDIDKLSQKEMNKVHNELNKDEYVITFWRSPSDKGYKGLIEISYQKPFNNTETDLQHKNGFNTLSSYFNEKYNIELDKSGSDITRLCFLSFDKDIVIKDKYSSFHIDNSKLDLMKRKNVIKKISLKYSSNRDALFNPKNRNNSYDRKLMSNLIRFLNNKNVSVTENYEDWCKVAMAISNTFTFDIGKKYFIKISKHDINKFNEENCINFLSNFYENRKSEVKFASIIYLANNKGFKTKYQKNGVPKVEGL